MKRGLFAGATASILAIVTSGTLTAFAATGASGFTTITTTSSTTPAVKVTTTASGNIVYTVVPGDTLYIISQKTMTNLPSLIAANPQIANVNSIYPGENIALPHKYIIQTGDTLYKISVRQGVSLASLEAANPQVSNYTNLFIGQMINLPPTSPAVTTSSAGSAQSASSGSTTPSVSSAQSSSPGSTVSPYTPSPSASSPTSPSTNSTEAALRQNIVKYAESLTGVPYVWGGTNPGTGFDCSGFVEYVYLHFGITLPRESHDMADQGTPVSQSTLQPGDLLFFKDTDALAGNYSNQVTHVGIYIGNGNMIESSSVNNKGVTIISNVFGRAYYVDHYYGARNVIS